MSKIIYERKRKIGLKLYEFMDSFSNESLRTFEEKYPDYETFKQSLNYETDAPIRYMQRIMNGKEV